MRLIWLAAGLICVGIGGIGIVVPLLPTTIFFIMAAWCFSRSNERLERWVLELPTIGPMVSDFRDGLGMPMRAKVIAMVSIVAACSLSAGLMLDNVTLRLTVIVVGAIGVWYVRWRVPTRPEPQTVAP